MALLTLSEAAIRVGYSVELLEVLIERPLKYGYDQKLSSRSIDDVVYIEERDLNDFAKYLHRPLQAPRGKRIDVPPAIKDDVRAESSHECAFCSRSDGEVAHIDAFADCHINGPDNLLYLCPNHHTRYDLGVKPSANVSREAVLGAKAVKRQSRRRMLRFEGNVISALRSTLRAVQAMETAAGETQDEALRATYTTELQALVRSVPSLVDAAREAASRDAEFEGADAALLEAAPQLARAALTLEAGTQTEFEVRSAATALLEVSPPLLDLDEVDCPHCGGRGQVGLVGDLCVYCQGDQVVSRVVADNYDPDEIDEVDCPRCEGRGQTGLNGRLCAFCRGRQVVSHSDADDYDPDEIDEVDCPRCEGRGQTGLNGQACAYCGGDQLVSRAAADDYDPDEIDEVDCPRCEGRGQTGLNGNECKLCRGDQVVSRATALAYNER